MAFPYVSELWKETTRPALSWHPCVYTHWFPPAMDDFHQAGFSSKIKTLFLLVSLRVKNPFQITSQSLSMKPPLVRANLGYLMEWGYNDHSLGLFSFLNKQVFSKGTAGGLVRGSYSPQKRVLQEQAVLPRRMSTFQSPFCLFSFLIIWSTLKPVQGPLT